MRLFHKHDWAFVNAENMVHQVYNYVEREYRPQYSFTLVTEMCTDCRDFKTSRVDGSSAEEIKRIYKGKK